MTINPLYRPAEARISLCEMTELDLFARMDPATGEYVTPWVAIPAPWLYNNETDGANPWRRLSLSVWRRGMPSNVSTGESPLVVQIEQTTDPSSRVVTVVEPFQAATLTQNGKLGTDVLTWTDSLIEAGYLRARIKYTPPVSDVNILSQVYRVTAAGIRFIPDNFNWTLPGPGVNATKLPRWGTMASLDAGRLILPRHPAPPEGYPVMVCVANQGFSGAWYGPTAGGDGDPWHPNYVGRDSANYVPDLTASVGWEALNRGWAVLQLPPSSEFTVFTANTGGGDTQINPGNGHGHWTADWLLTEAPSEGSRPARMTTLHAINYAIQWVRAYGEQWGLDGSKVALHGAYDGASRALAATYLGQSNVAAPGAPQLQLRMNPLPDAVIAWRPDVVWNALQIASRVPVGTGVEGTAAANLISAAGNSQLVAGLFNVAQTLHSSTRSPAYYRRALEVPMLLSANFAAGNPNAAWTTQPGASSQWTISAPVNTFEQFDGNHSVALMDAVRLARTRFGNRRLTVDSQLYADNGTLPTAPERRALISGTRAWGDELRRASMDWVEEVMGVPRRQRIPGVGYFGVSVAY